MSVVDVLALVGAGVEGRADVGAPDRAVLAGRGRSWTRAELERDVDREAERIRAEGPPIGSVAPVVLEPDPEGVIRLLALWRAGLVAAPLNPRSSSAEQEAAGAALDGVRVDGQAVLWTSGTTGRPRGVVLSADNLRASVAGATARLALGPGDVWLASLSPAHVGGLVLIVRALWTGALLRAEGRLGVEELAEALGSEPAPTHVSLVPTHLLGLLERGDGRAPPSLRCVLLGGAHAPPSLVHRATAAGWPVALTYGATEATSQVATATPADVRADPVGVGRPLDGVEVRIDGHGQILVGGPTLAAEVGADGQVPVAGDDGWYRTGDLGRMRQDGRLEVTGRLGDRIVSGGVTLHAAEVEDALREHPAVRDCAVVGLPDFRWGEVVGAWIVPIEGEFDLDALDGWAARRLGTSKRPRRWRTGAALPLNPNGKVDRGAVRSALLADHEVAARP